MKFKKELLQDLVYNEVDGYEVIINDVMDTSRWSINKRMVFKFDNKYYVTFYSVGATEQQYEEPYEYEKDLIECREVKPVKKTVTVYE